MVIPDWLKMSGAVLGGVVVANLSLFGGVMWFLDRQEDRLSRVEDRLSAIEPKLAVVQSTLEHHSKSLEKIDGGIGRLLNRPEAGR